MDREFTLEVMAKLGAHERLISDLLINFLVKLPEPLRALDDYTARIDGRALFANLPHVDAAESDLINQQIEDSLLETLRRVRGEVQKHLGQSR